jgi:hypothetical protein
MHLSNTNKILKKKTTTKPLIPNKLGQARNETQYNFLKKKALIFNCNLVTRILQGESSES